MTGFAAPRTWPKPIDVARRVRRALSHEIWNIGVVDQTVADIAARGIISTTRWLPDLPRFTMLADPSCRIDVDGGLWLFAEHLDYRHPRGEIWDARVPADGDIMSARFAPLIRKPFHLSYPVLFDDADGCPCLAAESWQSGGVPLWRLVGRAAVSAGAWLQGRQPVDPTLLYHNKHWFLFCSFRDDAPDARLHLFHTEQLGGGWTAVSGNPVRKGLFGSRSAGPIFTAGDQLIRPAQDCTATYGGGIVLHRILRLDPGGYAEEIVRQLRPIPGCYDAGLHTICSAGARTLIDGKRWQLDPVKPLRRLRRK